MNLTIEAICYDLDISEERARFYSFLHEKVLEYGGVPQFVQNKDKEIDRLRKMYPPEVARIVLDVLPPEAQQMIQDTPLDTFDPVFFIKYDIQCILKTLEDPRSLNARIRVYRDKILPICDQYTEEIAVETLKRKHQRRQEERRRDTEHVKKLLGNEPY